jgi:hypothetical protein
VVADLPVPVVLGVVARGGGRAGVPVAVDVAVDVGGVATSGAVQTIAPGSSPPLSGV